MSESQPVFDQINLVVRDMDAALAFYRKLGLTIEDPPEWPPGSGAKHAEAEMPSGIRLELDNHAMVAIWYPGWVETKTESRVVLCFSFSSRTAVDETYARMTAAGHAGRQAPHDAFWGSRFAIIRDPDGNDVGLLSPPDPEKRFVPEPRG